MTTDPDAWFVDPASATSGNLVTPLIDGISMMTEFQNQFNQLTSGDFLFLAAWQIQGTMILPGATKELVNDLIDKINLGIDIRISLFRGMPIGTHRAKHLEMKALIEQAGGQIIIDMNHPHPLGSHHGKYAIFGRQEAGGYILTAFCGGIDLGSSRQDDSDHKRIQGGTEQEFLGWHDIHAKIEGPAAETILSDFVRRWNDHPDAATTYKSATTRIDTSLYALQLPLLPIAPHRVEVLYNYHCSNFPRTTEGPHGPVEVEDVIYYSFVNSSGIHTILGAYLKAIAAAKHYIYIENLFFYEEQISTALRDKLNEVGSNIHIIFVGNFGQGGDAYALRQYMSTIQESENAVDRLHVCALRHTDGNNEDIFVHSKLMIVDDLYFTVGSANLTPRSVSYDTEINIGVLGEDLIHYEVNSEIYTVSQSVRDFRVTLWREHLQLVAPPDTTDEPDPDDDPLLQIPTALETWITRTDDPSSRVCSNDLSGGFPNPIFYLILHPSESCD